MLPASYSSSYSSSSTSNFFFFFFFFFFFCLPSPQPPFPKGSIAGLYSYSNFFTDLCSIVKWLRHYIFIVGISVQTWVGSS
ncbi:hypothetical protein G7K_4807-t1 [Saitoella complicata NRRL Y-17804]|uniref:Uncharacterized protein n=1 Tax=Saitoella complicata (strain BCRC 22490 / CBS 7301 / JCM 7358 / NBRC 10748 / NRRL Y-17804) TaxID=698492 RepID=A0A0E9NMN5_SAICN|nr:hypothetical protein G7K_4807-t1 [Saitoella complicata NRRL Y-17804]